MPAKVIISGTKITIKQTGSIAVLLSSVKSLFIQPEKGSKNPPHIQHAVKFPKK